MLCSCVNFAQNCREKILRGICAYKDSENGSCILRILIAGLLNDLNPIFYRNFIFKQLIIIYSFWCIDKNQCFHFKNSFIFSPFFSYY